MMGGFAINIDNGAIRVVEASVLDFESNDSFLLNVEVSDGNESARAVVTVGLIDVQEGPDIVDQVFTIEENVSNNTLVGSVEAVDPESDALTYRIIDGAGQDAFLLNSNNGVLTVANSTFIDFEMRKTFVLTVEVSDGTFMSNGTITINVNDMDESPVLADQSFNIEENAIANSLIGTVVASDPEGSTLSYRIISGNDLGGFSIETNTGNLNVLDASVFNAEVNPTFTLGVSVSDGNLSSSAQITISVMDLDESPSVVDQIFSIDENSPNGTLVGTVEASDPEGATLTYSIVSGNEQGGFTLEAGTGAIAVADITVLDFETTPTFSFNIAVSDGNLSSIAVVAITLNDVDEVITDVSEELLDITFEVFPVPARDELNIQVENDQILNWEIGLIHFSGRELKVNFEFINPHAVKLDISDVPNGVYIVQLSNGEIVNRNKIYKR